MKIDCHKCVHKLDNPGTCHIRCNNHQAIVNGHPHGIRNGWFNWPLNFDPVWLIDCTGFSDKPEDRMPKKELEPLIELLSILGGAGRC